MAPSLGPGGKMTKDARYDYNISSTSSAFFPLVVKILDWQAESDMYFLLVSYFCSYNSL